MKKLFFGLLFLYSQLSLSQVVLWTEDFSVEADNAVTGTAGGTLGGTWNVTAGGGAACSKQTHFLGWEGLQFNQNGGSDGVWSSGVINIAGLGDVAISAVLACAGSTFTDYVQIFYKIDGGAEVLFGALFGTGGISLNNPASAIISGGTLEIIIRGRENTAGNFCCGLPNAMGADDIIVTDITTLYSIATGNWNNSNTWSSTGYGGVTCSPCLPSQDTKVFIGNGRTVSLTAAGDAIEVNVENTGRLQWTGTFDLNIRRGGLVHVYNGGTFTHNGNTGAQIDFDEAYSNSIIVDTGGTLAIGDIDNNGNIDLTISGGGTFTVADDFLMGVNDAVITNNMTGSLTIADQLNFEVGGVDFINNSPSMTVQGTAAAIAVVYTGNNNLLSNTGTLSVPAATRSFSFGAASTGNSLTNSGTLNAVNIFFDNDNSSVTNSGTLVLTGNIQAAATDDGNSITNTGSLSFVAVNIADADLTINNSGTINQGGNFTSNTIDLGSSFNNLAGGVWNWTLTPNAGFDADVATILNCSAVNNTFSYAGAGNQTLLTLIYHHLTFAGSGTKLTSVSLDINGNLTIQGDAQLNVDSGNDDISLGGNWTVTSTNADPFVQGAGTEQVVFDGTADQTITNANGETFCRVTVSKTSGNVILADDVTIAGGTGTDLTLTQGKIISSAASLITIVDNASTTVGDADSYVDGPIRKIGNDGFVFPTGDGTIWARLAITAPATITTEFTAEYFGSNFGDISHDASLNDPSDNEYWTLNRAVTADGVRVTLFWEDNVRSQINDAVSGDLVVARHNGTLWISEGQFSISSAGSTGSVTSNVITSFSPITFGSLSSGVNPLPVELIFFKGDVVGDEINLSWETASETNNDFFTVERFTTGEVFSGIGQVKGNGTARKKHSYKLTDFSPIYGTSYYRLKQTDYDGTFAYSDVISVTYEGPATVLLSVYPNPLIGNELTVRISGNTGDLESIPVVIIDQLGREWRQITLFQNPTSGMLEGSFTFENRLPTGFYLIKAGGTLSLTRRLIVAGE